MMKNDLLRQISDADKSISSISFKLPR